MLQNGYTFAACPDIVSVTDADTDCVSSGVPSLSEILSRGRYGITVGELSGDCRGSLTGAPTNRIE